jgi:hypothetical protein
LLDFFTPEDSLAWNAQDADLGSALLSIPGATMFLSGGEPGIPLRQQPTDVASTCDRDQILLLNADPICRMNGMEARSGADSRAD